MALSFVIPREITPVVAPQVQAQAAPAGKALGVSGVASATAAAAVAVRGATRKQRKQRKVQLRASTLDQLKETSGSTQWRSHL